MRRPLILGAVLIALAGVIVLKVTSARESAPQPAETPAAEVEGTAASRSVLLFADPREADANCGCAEIIGLARAAQNVPGIRMREFDTRRATSDEAKRHRVTVSPTVIIAAADGSEQERFEGESADVIVDLESALGALRAGPATEEPR